MEEDNLKNYIQTYSELKRNKDIVKSIDKDYFFELTDCLIKAYKEKEYKYNKALSDLVQAEHENKELKEENEVWKNNYYEQKEFNNKQALYIKENFIPVALVEEKIEELKEKADEDNKEEYIKIQALQELLEKRE